MSEAGFGYCCAVVVAVVFTVAAVAKWRDPVETARSFTALGLPYASVFARVVPMTELSIALLLIVAPTIGAFAAVATLVFFTTFLVVRLRAGVTTPCSCFGSAGHDRLSVANLVGNGFLILASVAALGADIPTRPTAADLAVVAVLVGVEVLAHGTVRRAVTRAPG
jgi:uncharacterized membrane protein YphA (DoxX/SURF4 family)